MLDSLPIREYADINRKQTDSACKVRAASGLAAISELNSSIRGITTIFHSIITFFAQKWCVCILQNQLKQMLYFFLWIILCIGITTSDFNVENLI